MGRILPSTPGDGRVNDLQALRRAFGHFATGVTIVTTRDREGAPVGVTASSFNTVSLSPPLVLWSIARNAFSFDTFATASHFAIHVLEADQRALSDRFARASSDKFAGIRVAEGAGGVPLIEGIQTVFECETAQRHEGGDHLILVGQVLRFQMLQHPADPLLFHCGRYATVDHGEGIPA